MFTLCQVNRVYYSKNAIVVYLITEEQVSTTDAHTTLEQTTASTTPPGKRPALETTACPGQANFDPGR